MEKMHRERVAKYRDEIGIIPPHIWGTEIEFEGTKIAVSEVASRAMNVAASKNIDAGMNGEHHDGGSGEIIKSLACWLKGLENVIPDNKFYKSIARQMIQEENPEEFAEYERLHAKYGA